MSSNDSKPTCLRLQKNCWDIVTSPTSFFVATIMDGRPLQRLPLVYRGDNATSETLTSCSDVTLNSNIDENSEFNMDDIKWNSTECNVDAKYVLEGIRGNIKASYDVDINKELSTCTSLSERNTCRHPSRSRWNKPYLDLKIIAFMLLLFAHGIGCLDNNILQLNIPTEEPVLDPNTVCKTFPDLSRKQYRLCAKYPDVTASAIQGIQIAIHECQHQLKEHRWNCSSLEKRNKNPHSSPLLKKGYKESAFAYALSSAGVTYQVSKACSMGKLKSCGCDMSMQGEVRDKFEWGGCSHNVDFGDSFAKKFTTARETARDIHARINLHNNRAGRLTILKNVRRQCKCHGMSGSCEIKTCWKVSPDFRIVGDILKNRYHTASMVNLSNKVESRKKRRLVRKQRNTQLVFYENSPNFCEANNKFDSPGTTGRFCNKSSTGYGNCDTLCCGRGYNTLKVRRTERCNCKFHWCCYVVCQTCTYNEWVTVCK